MGVLRQSKRKLRCGAMQIKKLRCGAIQIRKLRCGAEAIYCPSMKTSSSAVSDYQDDSMVFLPLQPEISASTVFVWKKPSPSYGAAGRFPDYFRREVSRYRRGWREGTRFCSYQCCCFTCLPLKQFDPAKQKVCQIAVEDPVVIIEIVRDVHAHDDFPEKIFRQHQGCQFRSFFF